MPSWRALRPRDPYYQAWLRYRRDTRSSYRGMVHLGLFVVLAIFLLMIYEKARPPEVVGFVLAGVLTSVGTWLLNVASRTSKESLDLPCPRCRQPFLRGPTGDNGWARECLNCGLPKWAPRDPSPQHSAPATPPARRVEAIRRPTPSRLPEPRASRSWRHWVGIVFLYAVGLALMMGLRHPATRDLVSAICVLGGIAGGVGVVWHVLFGPRCSSCGRLPISGSGLIFNPDKCPQCGDDF